MFTVHLLCARNAFCLQAPSQFRGPDRLRKELLLQGLAGTSNVPAGVQEPEQEGGTGKRSKGISEFFISETEYCQQKAVIPSLSLLLGGHVSALDIILGHDKRN